MRPNIVQINHIILMIERFYSLPHAYTLDGKNAQLAWVIEYTNCISADE